MKPLRKFVTLLIGYDRRERRGTYVLSVILLAFLLVRVVAFRPGKMPDELSPLPVTAAENGSGSPPAAELFSFDPNDAAYEDLLKLGLSERQARTLINYRNSGARFRRPEDLSRVYGIDSATKAGLIPYIVIGDAPPAADRSRSRYAAGSSGSGYTAGRDSSGSYPGSPSTGAGTAESLYGRESSSGSSYARESSAQAPSALIDLNLSTAEELTALPGIGPVLSVRIIRYRSLLGGFVESSQLKEVYGLDSSVVRMIEGRLTLTLDSVRPLNLDSVTFGDLARHPYLGYEAARRITRYRTVSKEPVTLGSMVSCGVISTEQAERIAPYVRPQKGASGSDYEFISSKVLK